ncbi:MAG: hypothetical protein ACREYC_16855 [Gammaproteobacteria bacterium]
MNLAKKLDWLMNALKELPEATAYNRYRSIHTSWVPRSLTLFVYVLPATAFAGWLVAFFAAELSACLLLNAGP